MLGMGGGCTQLRGRAGAGVAPGDVARRRVTPSEGARGAGELEAICRLQRRLPPPPAGELWIGDDAAVFGGWRHIVASTDLTVAGVHADLTMTSLDDLGWKAVGSAASDLAAMGAAPSRLLVAVAGPPDTDLDLLYDGIAEAATAHGCPVVGGDLSNAAQLTVAVTVLGGVDAPPEPVRRSGARTGHTVLVSRPLGAASAGLRLLRGDAEQAATGVAGPVGREREPDGGAGTLNRLRQRRPVARIAAGIAARMAGASAMIDVSDGLAADLWHVIRASQVAVDLSDVPVAEGATVDEALAGGEDYELVMVTAEPDALVEAVVAAGEPAPVRCGTCMSGPPGLTLAGSPVAAAGWQHRWGGSVRGGEGAR